MSVGDYIFLVILFGGIGLLMHIFSPKHPSSADDDLDREMRDDDWDGYN